MRSRLPQQPSEIKYLSERQDQYHRFSDTIHAMRGTGNTVCC